MKCLSLTQPVPFKGRRWLFDVPDELLEPAALGLDNPLRTWVESRHGADNRSSHQESL